MLAALRLKRRRLIFGCVAIACSNILLAGLGTRAAAQKISVSASAHVVATAQLYGSIPSTQSDGFHSTVVFFSENALALVLCGSHPNSDCHLSIAELSGGNIHLLARTEDSYSGTSLFRSSDGFILESGSYWRLTAQLYSHDLSVEEQIPAPRYVSLTGRTIAVLTKASPLADKDEWALYNVRSSPRATVEKLGDIVGDLQAVGDDKLVIRANDTMQTETLDGKALGAFAVKPKSKQQTTVQFAGEDRLYVSTWHHDRIADFNGEELMKLRAPAGWGFSHGWSANGKRLLFDHYTRKISSLRSAGEDGVAVATLGVAAVGINQEPNGEAIRVIDTTTGNACFDWSEPKGFADAWRHADISPDGKLVAVIAGADLTIYRLPDSCGKD